MSFVEVSKRFAVTFEAAFDGSFPERRTSCFVPSRMRSFSLLKSKPSFTNIVFRVSRRARSLRLSTFRNLHPRKVSTYDPPGFASGLEKGSQFLCLPFRYGFVPFHPNPYLSIGSLPMRSERFPTSRLRFPSPHRCPHPTTYLERHPKKRTRENERGWRHLRRRCALDSGRRKRF